MALMSPVAVVVLGPSGIETAGRVGAALAGARLHGRRGRVPEADALFDDLGDHLRGLFAAGVGIVGIAAAGVLVRALAPVLADKREEPPVVAVAEDGSAVVPILGGHRGANELARTIARALGAEAAVTTAGDVRFGVALDDPPPGWRIANPEHVKDVVAALLAGERLRLQGALPWLRTSKLPLADDGTLLAIEAVGDTAGDARRLVYHPAVLAVGVGCERGASADEVVGLVRRTLAGAGLSPSAVGAVVSLEIKADEPAVHAAAADLDVAARFFSAAELEAETPRLANPSAEVFREVGCHGVAEAAALAASGPQGRLLVPKTRSSRATSAVALAPAPIDPRATGRPRGHLALVGIGPGGRKWRTPEADALVAQATDVVGYGLYLDLLDREIAGQVRHAFPMGSEEARVRAALNLAAKGRRVALVSSGDPGIYALAALVFELLERESRPDWTRVEIAIAPGVSAMQAAAARAGAPLGHDFCAISLSDLLTPWETIERRVAAAAEADFVVAFYNPASAGRRTQLARARDILLAHRSPATPVVVARNLGRADERLETTTLAALDGGAIDMLTIVLVGATTTRAIARPGAAPWVYTPRGYGAPRKDRGGDR